MHTRFTLANVLRLASACIALTVTQTQASTITPNYERQYLLGQQGSASTDVTDLVKLNFDAAVEWWEMALPTNAINLTIDVKLMNLGGGNSAGRTRYDTKDAQGFVDSATIWFNENTAKWFLDATPHENSEFTMTTSELNQNGATTDKVNSGRYSTASTIGDNWDFLAVAKHEIGHALGIVSTTGTWQIMCCIRTK